MTLSALSGSVAGGLALGAGLHLRHGLPPLRHGPPLGPLPARRRFLQARPVTLRAGGHTLHTNTINIGVAAFTNHGGFVLYLAGTGTMTSGPGFQAALGQSLARTFERLESWTAGVPEPVLGLAVLALAAVFVLATLRDRRQGQPAGDGEDDTNPVPEHTCHDSASEPEVAHDQHLHK